MNLPPVSPGKGTFSTLSLPQNTFGSHAHPSHAHHTHSHAHPSPTSVHVQLLPLNFSSAQMISMPTTGRRAAKAHPTHPRGSTLEVQIFSLKGNRQTSVQGLWERQGRNWRKKCFVCCQGPMSNLPWAWGGRSPYPQAPLEQGKKR